MISNLDYYRSFWAAASLGSATKAAPHLHLTQSGVSQAIQKIEKELNVTLFIRKPRGMELTPEGTILFQYVQRAFAELAEGERKVEGYINSRPETLSIGATETSIRFFLADVLHEFKQKSEKTELVLKGDTVISLCQLLKNGHVEAALLYTPFPTHYQFDLREIASVQDILVAQSDYPANPRSIKELAQETVISVSDNNSIRFMIDQWFLSSGIVFHPSVTVASAGLILPLVKAGLGIGIVPYLMAEKDLKDGTIRQIMPDILPPARKLFFATRRGHVMSGPCEELLRLLQEKRQ